MSSKIRKDKNGYALKKGESQRKDGRYCYSFVDRYGKRQFLYSKTLVELRMIEKDIHMKYDMGLDPMLAKTITLNDLYDKYMQQKHNLKETTRENYLYVYNHFVRESFGNKRICNIKYSDVEGFYYNLLKDKKLKATTLESVHTQIHPALNLAVRDDLLRKNPADFVMSEIKKSYFWDKPKRKSLTIEQQREITKFMENNAAYAGWTNLYLILVGTGLRIGECLALRWEDLDFEKKQIRVEHSLSYRKDLDGKCRSHIQTPKTEAGKRIVPMLDDVAQAFLQEYSYQKCTGFCEEIIDGYSGFVFTSSNKTVPIATSINAAFKHIVNEYNQIEVEAAAKEKREAVIMPLFSAHILRHTFSTRCFENTSNVKVLQTIMGHSDFSTTMDIYTDVSEEMKGSVIDEIEGKIVVR